SGAKVDSKDWNYYSTEFVWSAPNQKMYFFRDDTSPNDLLWEEINANGKAYTNQPGGIGASIDSPLHDSAGFTHPIRVAPDGSIVVLGSGAIHNALTLARLTTSLANSFTDAAWLGGELRTVRNISGVAQFQQWTTPNYGQNLVRQVPGSAYRLFALDANRLLAVCLQNAMPAFYELDASFNVIAPLTLEPPGGVYVTVASPTQVNLYWQDANGEEAYAIERKTGTNGTWVEIGTATTSVTQFNDNSVALGGVYSYRVLSKNGSLISMPSAVVSALLVPPGVPADLTIASVSTNTLTLTWTDVSFETNYLLEQKTGTSGSWNQISSLPANTSTFTVSSLTPNTQYSYRLRTANGVGISDFSPSVTATTLAVPPSVPYLYSAYTTAPYYVTLYWSSSSYADTYILERRLSNATWTVATVLNSSTTSFLDTNVLPLTAYEYRLYATNRAGASGYSATRSVTTPALPAPAAPTGLWAKPLSGSSLLITWSDGQIEEGYRLERRTDNPTAWSLIAVLPANTSSFTDTNLLEGRQYVYRLQAFNKAGTSPYSAEAAAVPVQVVNLIEDDFDPDWNPALWAEVSGGVATNGGPGFRASKALWFGASGLRRATTLPLAVPQAGTLQFLMRAGNETVDGNACWNNSESGESIQLEYSTDRGVSWVALRVLDTQYPSLTNWTAFSIDLPN
ncbi:MAG TPA: fibronectin type III domain-containing protein, partial [Candidatus Sulfotelmatobacter sp.]|nr:fibronectin type III domain-containing protein [Candidatus Sulfotelmatobacter sp.]